MKTLIIPCVIAIHSLLFSSLFAQEQSATSEQKSTQATLKLPQSFESAFKTITDLSVISTYSTVTTSASNALDSLSRKDDSAIILTALSTTDVGIGGKLWVTEQTVLKAYLSMGLGLDFGLPSNFMAQQSANSSRFSQVRNNTQGGITPSLTNNSSVFASFSIEKHIFSQRKISPFLGVGINAGITFNQRLAGNIGGQRAADSTIFQGSMYGNTTTSQNAQGTQSLSLIDSYRLGGSVNAGVEYFILPSISLAAQIGVTGGVRLYYDVKIQNTMNTAQNSVVPLQSSQGDQQITLAPIIGLFGHTWFAISGQVYLGRGAAKEIGNAFASIFTSW